MESFNEQQTERNEAVEEKFKDLFWKFDFISNQLYYLTNLVQNQGFVQNKPCECERAKKLEKVAMEIADVITKNLRFSENS